MRRVLLVGASFPGLSGPFAVGIVTARLRPPGMAIDEPIIEAQVWYPADPAENGAAAKPALSWLGPLDTWQRTGARAAMVLSRAQGVYPVIIYAPAGRGRRSDNSFALANLASHGYVVAAVDDVGIGPADTIGKDDARLSESWDFSSAEAYERSLVVSAERVGRQARKGARLLDALEAGEVSQSAGQLRGRLDLKNVGFLGYSFGGAAAAEATWLDARFVAAANLDGAIYGQAASAGVEKPYLVLTSDEGLPGPGELNSPDPNVRYYTRLVVEDYQRLLRQANLPNTYCFTIRHTLHEHFGDALLTSPIVRYWRTRVDPLRTRAIIDAYLLAFFDTHLKARPNPLLYQNVPPYPEVHSLKATAFSDGAVQR